MSDKIGDHRSVEFLRDYNAWRLDLPRTGDFPEQPDPYQVGEAIEWACGQIELGAIRYADALERIENQAAEWEALEAVCKEQHQAIAACANALHQARRAIAAYAEVKGLATLVRVIDGAEGHLQAVRLNRQLGSTGDEA